MKWTGRGDLEREAKGTKDVAWATALMKRAPAHVLGR
jgi:hypothetical protein